MTWYSEIVGEHADQLPLDDLCSYILAVPPVHKINSVKPGVIAGSWTTETIKWTLTSEMRDYIKENLLDGKEFCSDCARASKKFKEVERFLILHGFPCGLISFVYGNSSLTWWRTL